MECSHQETQPWGKDVNGNKRLRCRICNKTFLEKNFISPDQRTDHRIALQLLILGYSVHEIAIALKMGNYEVTLIEEKAFPFIKQIKNIGQTLNINVAREYLSALDKGKRPERLNKNNTSAMSRRKIRSTTSRWKKS